MARLACGKVSGIGLVLAASFFPLAGQAENLPNGFREGIRKKLENLPPEERAQAMARVRKTAEANIARQPTAVLPQNVETIPIRATAGQTRLPWGGKPASPHPLTPDHVSKAYAQQAGSLAPAITEEQFIRRVYLDAIGHLPAPADVEEFVKSRSSNKRAELVDRLLSLPQFGEHWGKYWADVFRYRATNQNANRISVYQEEQWLADQINSNRNWGEITSAILTAKGLDQEAPAGFFVAYHEGEAVELAGEAARVFLGTQIACAQCHDHPYDPWKRDQFHEMAAFFGRTDFRIRKDLMDQKGARFVLEVGPSLRPQQQHRKPDLKDPSQPGEVMQPVFLSGQPLPLQTSDEQRRTALATFITSPNNPTFAKAYVNRMWYELVGYGFVEPMDDLSPQRPVRQPKLFDELSASFGQSNYDIKAFFRAVVLSSAYDRATTQRGESESSEEVLARRPSRLSAPEILANLEWVLGAVDAGARDLASRKASPRRKFEQVFGYDPSLLSEDVEGSIPQALLLMNNPLLEQRISAQAPGTLLQKLLKTQHDNAGIIDMLYLRVLGRMPTRQEKATCEASLRSVDRAEGLEDILWALLNSTEFVHQF